MNIGEIAERLIEAAEIIHKANGHGGPRRVKSLALPYSHDFADKAGWGRERLAEERKEFFESVTRQPTARQISEADEAQGWYALVSIDQNRECLSGWVLCMAGGGHFYDWCRKQGFHVETGRRRKDRALAEIAATIGGRPVQHCNSGSETLLRNTPEIGDSSATLADRVRSHDGIVSWSAEDAILTTFGGVCDFSWADKRNEIRRQREARRRTMKAAA